MITFYRNWLDSLLGIETINFWAIKSIPFRSQLIGFPFRDWNDFSTHDDYPANYRNWLDSLLGIETAIAEWT